MPEMPKGLLILVEDEESPREFAKMALANNGFDVWAAEDGQKARTFYDALKGSARIIVTDKDYPFDGGFEFIRYVRETERRENRPYTPIIMLTGNSNDWSLA